MFSKLFLLTLTVTATFAQQPLCNDGSKPSCRNGSALIEGEFPPCADGPPICADGSELDLAPPFKPCDDGSKPSCPDGSALVKGEFPPCKDGKPVCADGTAAKKPPHHGGKGKGKKGKHGKHGKKHGKKEDKDDKDDGMKHGKDDMKHGENYMEHGNNNMEHGNDNIKHDNEDMTHNKHGGFNTSKHFERESEGRGRGRGRGRGHGRELAIGFGSLFIGIFFGVVATRCCCRRAGTNATNTTEVVGHFVDGSGDSPRIVVLGQVGAAPSPITKSKNAIVPYFNFPVVDKV